MKRLYFAAVANRYADNVFLPYAAGLMWSYAAKFKEVTEAYELCDMLYLKEPISVAVDRLDRPDVLAISSYIWNHEWNKLFAQAVKHKWPECRVLVGGVQVPDESPRILLDNEQFDFAIYGEGEAAFAGFLRSDDYTSVGSLIWRRDGRVVVNPRHASTPLEDIPSPYLEGVFDRLVSERRWKFQALHETNRGCPYACTFCEWGAASLSKLRQFPEERLVEEIEWFGKSGIEFVFNCDANYGILKRDLALTDALVATNKHYGYPRQMRACFAKNSNDVVFDISRRLFEAGMHKATTLALQSLNDETLGLIKRKNIRYDKLAELAARYEAEGIPTFTEIIIGLPGETWDTFVSGIDKVLEAHIHDGISIYLCVLLENTEMNTSEYLEEHCIESVTMKALMYHGTPESGAVEEIQETVVATRTLPRDDLRRVVLYGWLIQALHGFGLTQRLARRLHERGLRYRDFYVKLLDLWMEGEGVGGREIKRMSRIWDAAVRTESWATVDIRFGDIMWPPEEFLFLNLACDSERFYDELTKIMPEASDLVEEQRSVFVPPASGEEERYAREAVWFGRKGAGRKLRLIEEI